jgi:hypothetical protein
MLFNKLSLLSIGLLLATIITGCNTSMNASDDNALLLNNEVIINLSKNELAKHLNIAEDEISLVSVEAVDFSDASLGAPEPGAFYAQIITPGYIIKLEAGGQVYQYNADLNSRAVLYQENIAFPVDPGKIDDGKPWVPAD